MKHRYIIILIMTLCLCNLQAKAAPIDTVLTILKKINYNAYVGKPVDSLFKILPAGYSRIEILPSHNYKIGDNLVISYSDSCHVWIKVNRFRYFNPNYDYSLPAQGQWNISLFKKEDIAFTIVYKGAPCIMGCEHQFYH